VRDMVKIIDEFLKELETIMNKYCKIQTELHTIEEWALKDSKIENDLIMLEERLTAIIEYKIRKIAEKHSLNIKSVDFEFLSEYVTTARYEIYRLCTLQVDEKSIDVFAVLREEEEPHYSLELTKLYVDPRER